jgi:hypothetical protein
LKSPNLNLFLVRSLVFYECGLKSSLQTVFIGI